MDRKDSERGNATAGSSVPQESAAGSTGGPANPTPSGLKQGRSRARRQSSRLDSASIDSAAVPSSATAAPPVTTTIEMPKPARARGQRSLLDKAKMGVAGLTGLLLVVPALVNSGYDVYAALAKVPKTESQKINDELFKKYFNKQPVTRFPIPVKRDAGTVDVSFSVFDGGDIYIEFGKRSQWFPFPVLEKASLANPMSLIGSAHAATPELMGSGTFQQSDRFEGSKLIRERKWENGVLETLVIDPRSGTILERQVSKWEGAALPRPTNSEPAQWISSILATDKTVQSVPLRMFSDGYYATLTPLTWAPNSVGAAKLPSVSVPRGFVTALQSVPRAFWALLRPDPILVYSAMVHDYLYWEQRTTRAEADLILKEMLKELGADAVVTEALYSGARSVGGQIWEEYARARAAGQKRIVLRLPEDARTTWKEWQTQEIAYR